MTMATPEEQANCRIDVKEAGGITRLGADKREGYPTWALRITDVITDSGKRRGMKEMLDWAGAQQETSSPEQEQTEGSKYGLVDAAEISRLAYKAISYAVEDTVMTTHGKIVGSGMGFELWRVLKTDHVCRAQVVSAIVNRWLRPNRCADVETLRKVLPQWRKQFEEIEGMKARFYQTP